MKNSRWKIAGNVLMRYMMVDNMNNDNLFFFLTDSGLFGIWSRIKKEKIMLTHL